MLLSIQQKYIMTALRELRCLRAEQLQTILQGHFDWPEPEAARRRMDAMLRQMCGGMGDVHSDGKFVWLGHVQPDARILEAVDVMLELSEGRPQDFSAECWNPELLRFSLCGSSLRLFIVATLSTPSCGNELAGNSPGRVVWISDSGTSPPGLALPPKHFFAARQPDDSHRFYGS